MSTIKTKADVETHRDYGWESHPAVNVKVHGWINHLDFDKSYLDRIEGDDFSMEWIEAHMTEEEIDGFLNFACEIGWEDAESDAREIFGSHVKVYSEGRSGGWLVVHNLPDIEEWDAIMLGKWKKFAKWMRAAADDVPRRQAELIYINVYEPALVEAAKLFAEEHAALLPIQAGE